MQANLQAIGFDIELSGAPTGTWLTKYRDGKMAFGLSLWGPDYPDPADYLVFMPGELVGHACRLAEGLRPGDREARRASARDPTRPRARSSIGRSSARLNAVGPYFPLMQPTQVFARQGPENAVFNAMYQHRRHAVASPR